MMTRTKMTMLAAALFAGSVGGAYAASPSISDSPSGMTSSAPGMPAIGSGRSLGAAPGTSIGGSPSSQSLGAAPGTSIGNSGVSSGSLGAAPGTTIGGHP